MITHAEYNEKTYQINSDKPIITITLVKKSGQLGKALSPKGAVWKTIWENVKDDHEPKTKAKPKKSQTKKAQTKPTLAEKFFEKKQEVSAPHLIVEARAGTGKTTTLIEGLKIVKDQKTSLTPSPQQAAVWDSMKLSTGVKTVCFVAFNKSIAQELQDRVPESCDAMTMHSMGLKAVNRSFDLQPFPRNINGNRIDDFIMDELGYEKAWMVHKKFPGLIKATKALVSLCKMNLVGRTYNNQSYTVEFSELQDLASYYELEMNGNTKMVFDLVPKIITRCLNVAKDGCIDFNDMIWLPVILGLPVFKYDLLLVDEAQDLNRCQQALAMKAGKRLILCGDPKQAIYGFAGADATSMDRMYDTLSPNCEKLPLTVTRRCGKAIVKEAQKYVSDFESHETNSDGIVSTAEFKDGAYKSQVQSGDMLLCRCNAPLVSECMKFLSQGQKAQIQGRDIGQGLISLIDKMKSDSIPELKENLQVYFDKIINEENRREHPCENKIINMQDKHNCLICFADYFEAEDSDNVTQVKERIDSVFVDDRDNPGIKLSSIHKAKGLEANRVFLLQPEGATMPHPMAKSAWQREQEFNLLYVAITRAINTLVYVS